MSLAIIGCRAMVLGSKLLLTTFLAAVAGLEVVGQYGLMVGAVAVVPVVLGFGFMQALARTMVSTGIRSVVPQLVRCWGAVSFIYVAGGATWISLDANLRLGMERSSVVLISAILLLEHLNNDAYLLINNLKRPIVANVQMFVRAGAWIVLYIPLAALEEDLRSFDAILWFWAVGVSSSFVFALIVLRDAYRRETQTQAAVVERFSSTWKLYVGEVCNGFGVYVDRYVLGLMLGAKAAGLYVLFASFAQGIYTLTNTSVMQVYRPYLIQAHGQGRASAFRDMHAECTRATLKASAVMSLFCLVSIYIAASFLPLDSWVHHQGLLWAVFVVTLIRLWSDLQGYALFARGYDAAYAATTIACLAVSMAVSFLLIPVSGVLGAALAAALSFAVTGFIRLCILSAQNRAAAAAAVGQRAGVEMA